MKRLTLIAILSALSVSGQTKTKKAAAPATDSSVVTIPSNAVEGPDGDMHATDAQGKKWTYHKTPFGISKTPDKSAPAAAKKEEADTTTIATDAGDSVHFEKPSPFGTARWDKKKTDLDANEQSIWNRQKKQ